MTRRSSEQSEEVQHAQINEKGLREDHERKARIEATEDQFGKQIAQRRLGGTRTS